MYNKQVELEFAHLQSMDLQDVYSLFSSFVLLTLPPKYIHLLIPIEVADNEFVWKDFLLLVELHRQYVELIYVDDYFLH